MCSIDQLLRPECVGGLPITYLRVLAVMMPATLLVHFVALQRVKLNAAPRLQEATQPAARTAPDADGHTRDAATVGVRPSAARNSAPTLIYLKVEDHYVKAYTPAGSGLILMRFADAVAELSAHGLQVHRSYWVAKPYMKRVMPKDGRTVLRLTTGQDIPVSRTYLHAVRAALGDRAAESAGPT